MNDTFNWKLYDDNSFNIDLPKEKINGTIIKNDVKINKKIDEKGINFSVEGKVYKRTIKTISYNQKKGK